jgi:ribosomal protein L10
LVDWAKKIKELELKGACLDGEYFEGQAGVKRLSTFPTRDEAQAKVVQLMLSPAGNLISAATSAGSNVMGIIKEIQERLEKGEEIAKVG